MTPIKTTAWEAKIPQSIFDLTLLVAVFGILFIPGNLFVCITSPNVLNEFALLGNFTKAKVSGRPAL